MIFESGTQANIQRFLLSQQPGTTFVYSDFKHCGSYESIRSVVVDLCKKRKLVRICQGVYVKPSVDGSEYMPDNVAIAKEIDRKNGGKAVLFDEIAEEISRGLKPAVLKFHTNKSTRTNVLPDGTIANYYKDRICK